MTEENPGTRIVAIAKQHPLYAGMTLKELASAFDVSYETLRKWTRGEAAPSRNRAVSLAKLLGVRPETFMHGVAHVVNELAQTYGVKSVAQSVSLDSSTIAETSTTPTVQWGDKKMISGLKRFCVIAPDDSMHPVVTEGLKVEFEREIEPRNRDVVLVEDKSGDWYIRTYLKAPGGSFRAKPENTDFLPPMEREADGLNIIGVMIGTHGRRG